MTTETPTRPGAARKASGGPQFPAGVELIGSRMRSTNVERDVLDELHSPYIGARAVDVFDRVANALGDQRRPRSWSFTGPYGSGKSTLANLIDAILGHDKSRRVEAEAVLAEVSPGLAARLAASRDQMAPTGFLGAVAMAHREPLVTTLSRALHTAARRRWPNRTPKAVSTALARCADPSTAKPENVVDAVTALCAQQPLLLIIDEFGKTLEHLAGHSEFSSAKDDLFLLQDLAEKSAGDRGLPLFMMTLQHLSFMDYAAQSSELQTREWAKIQGRFEDITFAPHLGDAVQLMRRRLDQSAVTEPGRKLIQTHAEAAAQAWHHHGLNDVVDLKTQDFADLYPLHPLTAVAAPFLAAQIGQHDRSLAGFLNNDEPHTVRRSLASFSTAKPRRATTIQLPQLYDFFLDSGRTSLLASSNASRWIEIESRVTEANGLSAAEQNLLRTVGMLNLIDSDGALRATAAMIHFALHEPADGSSAETFAALEEQLNGLVDRGFLVYRAFNGEYRVWRGSNFDIDTRLKETLGHLDEAAVLQRLGDYLPLAVAAGRHSQITGMLRALFVKITGAQTKSVDGPDELNDQADGLLVFHLGTIQDRPLVDSSLPVVLGVTEEPDLVLRAAFHLVALEELQRDKSLDPVAQREISERTSAAKRDLLELLSAAFFPLTQRATWRLWRSGITADAGDGEVIESRSLSGLASIACDRVFPATPHIRNEMLGRHELTSQGAKSRRELLTAMLTKSGERHLGIDKYPAERAMYSGALEYMGLHRANSVEADDSATSLLPYGFSRPGPSHAHALAVWDALETALSDAHKRTDLDKIHRAIMVPPYGVKAGVVPLLVVTALILRSQDVALFEEGSYLPRLTADVVERMVKAPGRFSVKATPLGDGLRQSVVKKLSVALDVEPPRSQALRNPALLAVTRALIERVMVLTPYARRTQRISKDAVAVRSALFTAQDPDELLFHALPQALGLDPITPEARKSTNSNKGYAERLAAAVEEISGAERALRAEVVETISREFRLPSSVAEMRRALAARLQGFANVSLSLELRGFVAIALNEGLSDSDWLDPMIVRLSHSALGDWTDKDVSLFAKRVKEMAAALDRVSHLYKSGEPSGRADEDLQARLLTLTDKDGAEQRTLIYLPEQSRQEAESLAVSVVVQAEKMLGPDGARILLAALAQRVSEPVTPTAVERTE
ncbi:ATP-binding protein [Streptomyces salyersiae]|uniref:ATP-binding protein n=1 Tax=Streptomyces salyersiae TaxID=3075530 RepID=A0ABU2RPB5_9ACTN|nr:ATP-binding protein [Streptomyces sp. DSM 41770]MDT0430491.1 ATP-binding protein [Streptomyces sp. DSM 41770]